jgi:hypothetical protein
MASVLGNNLKLSTPIVQVKRLEETGDYELFTTGSVSLGIFQDVVFACHPPQALEMLKAGNVNDELLLEQLEKIQYADNAVYVHSDPKLMPIRKAAWASWNCMGRSDMLKTHNSHSSAKQNEAMEGAQSGFGNKVTTAGGTEEEEETQPKLEGQDGRMRAVYVTYWLNRLQNLKTDQNVFVSLNPHEIPAPELTHRRQIMAHPQFTAETQKARKTLNDDFQGKDGLWFCGAWQGHGFHEDGCRSGFEVATELTGIPLPWASNTTNDETMEPTMLLPAPDLTLAASKPRGGWVTSLYKALTYTWPVAICKKFITSFLHIAIQKGRLNLKLNDGSIIGFGDGTPCGSDASAVTLRVFDDWFFVKTALEYDLGLAR